MERVDLNFLRRTLIETLEGSEERASFKAVLVVLAVLFCGPRIVRLADITQSPREFVATIWRRMIQAGLWTELDVYYDHWFVSESLLRLAAFWCDVLIAEGLATRRWCEDEGDYRYSCTPSTDNNPKGKLSGTLPALK